MWLLPLIVIIPLLFSFADNLSPFLCTANSVLKLTALNNWYSTATQLTLGVHWHHSSLKLDSWKICCLVFTLKLVNELVDKLFKHYRIFTMVWHAHKFLLTCHTSVLLKISCKDFIWFKFLVTAPQIGIDQYRKHLYKCHVI